MKTRFIQALFTFVLCSSFMLRAQNFTYEGTSIWLHDFQEGHAYNAAVNDVERDAQGNTYVLMKVSSPTDLNPGAGIANFQAPNLSYLSMVLIKFNSQREYVWHKTWSRTDDGGIDLADIAVLSNGNVILVGSFYGQMDADPNAGEVPFTEYGNWDFCSIILNPNGEYVSRSSNGAAAADYGRQVEVDASGNVYLTISYTIGSNANMLRVVKLNSSLTTQWAADFTTDPTLSGSISGVVRASSNGDVFLAGKFYGLYDFNPGADQQNEVSNGAPSSNIYLVKLNSAGTYQWVKNIGQNDATQRDFGDLAIDNNGNAYLTMSYKSIEGGAQTLEIVPGNVATAISPGASLIKFNNSGAHQWNRTYSELVSSAPWAGTAANFKIAGIASDNKIYMSFDGYNNLELSSTINSNSRTFVAVADIADGIVDNAFFFESIDGETGSFPGEFMRAKVLNNGTLFTYGIIRITRDLNITAGTDIVEVDGNSTTITSYLSEYSQDLGSGPVSLTDFSNNNLVVFPNPTSGLMNIKNIAVGSMITITDISGRVVFSSTASNDLMSISTENWSNGLYLIQTELNGAVQQEKVVVQK